MFDGRIYPQQNKQVLRLRKDKKRQTSPRRNEQKP